jgi:hypothetical protein
MTNENAETKSHEKEVENFLINVGFSKIMSNETITDSKAEIGEIDSLFEYKNYLLIIEVSTKKRLDNQKKNFFFSKWSDDYNLRILRKKYNLRKKKTFRIYFDRVTKTPENHAGLDHITKRKKGNKVVYLDMYEKFQENFSKNPFSIQKNFLKWIEKS